MSSLARSLVSRAAAAGTRAGPSSAPAPGSASLRRPAFCLSQSHRWASSSSSSAADRPEHPAQSADTVSADVQGAVDVAQAESTPAGDVAIDGLQAGSTPSSAATEASAPSQSPTSSSSSSPSLADILGAAMAPATDGSEQEQDAQEGRSSSSRSGSDRRNERRARQAHIAAAASAQSHHRLHIQTTRNNTILTFTTPTGEPLASASGGTAGFKKSARSGYEAGYRAAFQIFGRIAEYRRSLGFGGPAVGAPRDSAAARTFGGLVTAPISGGRSGSDVVIETVWSGFGQGREAVFRALMTNEGSEIRNLVKRVTDGTPLKIGGVRPKKRRML